MRGVTVESRCGLAVEAERPPCAAANAPKPYRTWLSKRVRPLLRVHGLDGRAEEDAPRRSPMPGLAARPQFVTTSRGREAEAARLF